MTSKFSDSLMPQPSGRKPRVALMGEFSAGKSTLCNILLGRSPLPMRVTATRLPPVLMTYGAPGAAVVDMQGLRSEVPLSDLDSVSFDDTRYIHVMMEADTLALCDLIDMPGISDPNMPRNMWETVVGEADHVVWCTHATQAWRQSEAAIWDALRSRTRYENLLLITQYDKLRSPRDQDRVMKRIRKETEGLFAEVFPVSLLEALNAEEDVNVWATSGVAAFCEHLIEILMRSAPDMPAPEEDPTGTDEVFAGIERAASMSAEEESAAETPQNSSDDGVVRPRRVRMNARRANQRRAERQVWSGAAE
ncbi:dynamin family protein [uncultured Roseobacter sp.]|uniref:dynamin family protein n=1 Tax=uncultured Roseobacter sp. TaxID=114847 RepID=UPI00261406AD|nr:dynamin family protein [uncultured Roseobacter sp.]